MNLRRKSQKAVEGAAPIPKSLNQEKKINLKNKLVCITGTISGMTRIAAQNKLRTKYGASTSINLTQSCDYLIVGYGVGQNKLKLAKRYKIPTIDATEIFK